MADDKKAPLEGEDGKLYFNYPLHAVYSFKSSAGLPLFEYEITACEYIDEEERYSLACNGTPLAGTKSLEQVRLIFGFFDYDITDPGELKELPLLDEEVRQYFEDKNKQLNKLNVEANAALKGTEYFKLKSAIEALATPLRVAKSKGDKSEVADINSKIKDLKARQAEVLKEKGIDINILTKVKECPNCYDTGFSEDGQICGCALKRAEEIKRYNAELRLARRK